MLQFVAFRFRQFLQPFLVFIADVIPMYRFVTNNQTNQVGGVGQLAPAGKIHWQPEAGIEQERFQEYAGDFLFQRIVGGVMLQDNLRLALQRRIFLTPGIGRVYVFRLAKRRENRAVRAGMYRFHKADV